ncbi:MAG: alkaline phosphatase family protein [Bryobacteraceae bacterium]|nr:alkaline phosphatase family protein [Bryobacteraceae bacterium]
MRRSLVLLSMACSLCAARPLLVVSVDGLDHRYLRDADKLGLRIPNIRKILREGKWADGVVGVVPTVTWPSHTSLITGVPPNQHGILSNRRPRSDGGDYYWNVDLLKVPTLLNAVRAAGKKSGTITWPVTVEAPADFNLPEYFQKRNGGAMDLESIAKKSTPGLVDAITGMYPSFSKQWVDDRSRTQATMFLLREKRPDLLLVHFVDLDSEAHDTGPFSTAANAILEYTDELIGDILRVLPKDYAFALVSDHGFERTDKMIHLQKEIGDGAMVTPFLIGARSQESAARIRELRARPELGIGREIPVEELRRLAPAMGNVVAGWEPAPHFGFAPAASPAAVPAASSSPQSLYTAPHEKGNHGFWPTRQDYRSVFALWGEGISPERLGEIDMLSICGRLASVLDVGWPMQKN